MMTDGFCGYNSGRTTEYSEWLGITYILASSALKAFENPSNLTLYSTQSYKLESTVQHSLLGGERVRSDFVIIHFYYVPWLEFHSRVLNNGNWSTSHIQVVE